MKKDMSASINKIGRTTMSDWRLINPFERDTVWLSTKNINDETVSTVIEVFLTDCFNTYMVMV